MRRLSQRRAYVISLLAHAALWLLLLRYETRVSLARATHEATIAASRHRPTLQRNQAQASTDRLRRIHQVADQLAATGDASTKLPASAARKTETTSAQSPQASERLASANTPPPAASQPPESLDALYAQGRRDYQAAREKFIDAEAERLAKITGESVDSARQSVETAQPRMPTNANGNGAGKSASASANGSGKAGNGSGAATAELEWMQADAQRMLERAVELQQQGNSGTTVSAAAQRQAYEILNQSQQFAADAREFAPAVDWTALMGHPLTATSLYGAPDGAGPPTFHDLRRIEPEAEGTLRARFRQPTRPVQFTRHIGRHGTAAADWIAPDSWYIIGPFENNRREAVDRSFPPEIEIDRDATYTGKNGRPIAWEYVRVHSIGVVPPHPEEYAIYYAYTEVRADQPMDCWLALGSDDHSKLWVNGLMIWSDTRNEKEWTPTEGFRRIHLEPGVNRFLLRLENGWRGTMFSVALLLP